MRVAPSNPNLTLRMPVLAAVAMLVALPDLAFAQSPPSPREPIISVSGEGEASIAPDMAIVTLGVVRNAKTAEAALSAGNAAMAQVLQALKAQGIADRDMQTTNFSIYPQYTNPEQQNGKAPEIISYEVSNSVTVKLRDLSKIGGLLDSSIKLGVNQGGQIAFTNSDPETAMTEARKAAVAKALAKAKTLAEAAGVKLGRIIEINEGVGRDAPQPMMRMSMAKADAAPIATGENSYAVTVDVTFAIQP